MVDTQELKEVTKRLVIKDTLINIVYPVVVAILLLMQGILIGLSMQNTKSIDINSEIITHNSNNISRNSEIIAGNSDKIASIDGKLDEIKVLVTSGEK